MSTLHRFLLRLLRPVIVSAIEAEMAQERHRLNRLWAIHMELYFGSGTDPRSVEALDWLKRRGLTSLPPRQDRAESRRSAA